MLIAGTTVTGRSTKVLGPLAMVMTADPGAIPVTRPTLSTVATAELLELYVVLVELLSNRFEPSLNMHITGTSYDHQQPK